MQKLFGKTNYLVKLCPLDAFGLNILSFFFFFFWGRKRKKKKEKSFDEYSDNRNFREKLVAHM